jgi:hypothetical protein
MNTERSAVQTGSYEVKAWELNALLLELVLLGGVAVGALIGIGRKGLGNLISLPVYVWFLVGAVLTGIALYPIFNIRMRNAHGRELQLGKWLLWEVVSASLVGIVFALLGRFQ